MLRQFFLAILLSLSALLTGVNPVLAQEQCESVYGGGQICRHGEVTLDKLVYKSDGDIFVDNLGTDKAFKAGEEVRFMLRIKNIGQFKIDNVYVSDTLPSYLEYVSGPDGDDVKDIHYDAGSRVLSFNLKDLEKDETRDLVFKARVMGEASLPNGTACVTNYAKAEANGQYDADTAQVCVTKAVLGVTEKLPETGPSQMQYLLLEALGFAIVGSLYLRLAKKTSQ